MIQCSAIQSPCKRKQYCCYSTLCKQHQHSMKRLILCCFVRQNRCHGAGISLFFLLVNARQTDQPSSSLQAAGHSLLVQTPKMRSGQKQSLQALCMVAVFLVSQLFSESIRTRTLPHAPCMPSTPTPGRPPLPPRKEDVEKQGGQPTGLWWYAVVAGLLLLRRRRRSGTRGRALAKEASMAKEAPGGGQAGGAIMDTARIQSTGGTDVPLSAGELLS